MSEPCTCYHDMSLHEKFVRYKRERDALLAAAKAQAERWPAYVLHVLLEAIAACEAEEKP